MPLELQEVNRAEELAALEPEWRALWQRDPRATPFQSPDWLLPWTTRLWGGGRLCILAARRGGELAGLAPFFFWGFDGHPPVIRLSFLGAGISDYLDLIAAPAHSGEFAGRVLEWLSRRQSEWQICDLQELRPCSPLLRAENLEGLASAMSVCPVATLPGSMDGLRAVLSSKFRRNLDRSGVMLCKQGRVEFARAAGTDVPGVMKALFRLHEARWRERCGRGIFHTQELQAFHLEAARGLDKGGVLRLYTLRVNGEIIAVQYSLAAKRRTYSYIGGFDTAWGKYSPGALLLQHALRCAIEEGAIEADFLRSPEAYKYLWGARDRINRKLLIHASAFTERVA